MNHRPFSLVVATAEKLGGAEVLGCPVLSDADMVRVVVNGFPLASIDELRKGGVTDREVSYLIINARTLSHRRKHERRLTPEESDRAARVARIIALAQETFGSNQKADRWLHRSLGSLEGQIPMELIRTDSGARIVENLLARIAWGAAV